MSKKTLAVVCLGAIVAASAWAAGKDTLVVTGLTDSNGFTPSINGNPSEWFYATTVLAGNTVADTIPVQFDLSDTNSVAGETVTVTLSAVGQIAGDITFDQSPFNMTDPQSGVLHYVYVNASSLVAGHDYHANVQIDATPASGVAVSHSALHLLIHVVSGGTAPPTCYLTDSSGLLLNDCAGSPTDTGGEFFIVTNGRKVTSTNPGQFYYNLVWTNNTGSDVTFTSLGLNGTNVKPQGANSVHVLIYDASGFTANFDDVNQNGIPCGTSGAVCKTPITVPAGDTLWLTWHVGYSFVGLVPPADYLNYKYCPLPTLSGDATISVSALLANSDGSVKVPCGPVTANGYTLK